MNDLQAVESAHVRDDIPEFRAGDTVKVHVRVVEGGRERVQIFEGVVIARNGTGARASFTVRKMSFGVGVERVFPGECTHHRQSRGGAARGRSPVEALLPSRSGRQVRPHQGAARLTDQQPGRHLAPEDQRHSSDELQGRRRKKRAKKRSFWGELPGLLLTALVIAVLIKTFLVQPFWIPSESMLDTIHVNDRVMVNKLAFQFGEPERGDIVVFRDPASPELDESIPEAVIRSVLEAVGIRTRGQDDLIKRVVGLPGETITVSDNQVHIDGVALEEPYLAPTVVMPDAGPFEVGEDEVFVMGDNRQFSFRQPPLRDHRLRSIGRTCVRDHLARLEFFRSLETVPHFR